MIELPEANTLAAQLNANVRGERIGSVVAAASPHKFAWFLGDPQTYANRMRGRTVGSAQAFGGIVEIDLSGAPLILAEGINLRLHESEEGLPKKHQLVLGFEDGRYLSASIQMYGGIWFCDEDPFENPYYVGAKEKPSPLSDSFSLAYFRNLIDAEKVQTKSAKAFCATEQRVPGLGNGVLHDILFSARLHPKRRISDLCQSVRETLYESIRAVLADMTGKGGRNTEKNLHDEPGSYDTRFCKGTVGTPCPGCAAPIEKDSYMGGSVYFCARCQEL